MKLVVRLLLGISLLLIAVAGIVWYLFDAEQIRPQLEEQLTAALGRPVAIGQLELALSEGQLVARQIEVGDDPVFSADPFVEAAELELSVSWLPLLKDRRLQLRSLRLLQPQVALRQNARGQWNFSSLGVAASADSPTEDSAAAPALSVDQLRIEQGQVQLALEDGRERIYSAVNLSADRLSMSESFPFTLRAQAPDGGSMSVEGQFGPWRTGAAMQTPMRAEVNLTDLDLAGSGLVGASADVAGQISFNGSFELSDALIQMRGKIHATELQLAAGSDPLAVPLIVDYQASYELSRRRGELKSGTLGTGGNGLEVRGEFVQTPKGLFLDLRAGAQSLAVDEVQALLPAFAIRLPEDARLEGGTLGAQMQIKGTLDSLEVAGPVELQDTRMVGFSLGDQLSVALSLAGVRAPGETRIAQANLVLRSSPSGMRIGDLSASVVDLGQISGEGRVAADGALDFQLKLVLDQQVAQSGGALGGAGSRILGFASTSGVGIKVDGNLDDPHFAPDQSTVANALVSGLLGSRRESADQQEEKQPEDVVGSLFQGLSGRKKKD